MGIRLSIGERRLGVFRLDTLAGCELGAAMTLPNSSGVHVRPPFR